VAWTRAWKFSAATKRLSNLPFETAFPQVASTLCWCRLPSQCNDESAALIHHGILLFHVCLPAPIQSHFQRVHLVHGLAVDTFLKSMHHFVQLLEVQSSSLDSRFSPPQGGFSLPLQPVRLQKCVNLVRAKNVHVKS
jgi:hypothetical protein